MSHTHSYREGNKTYPQVTEIAVKIQDHKSRERVVMVKKNADTGMKTKSEKIRHKSLSTHTSFSSYVPGYDITAASVFF